MLKLGFIFKNVKIVAILKFTITFINFALALELDFTIC